MAKEVEKGKHISVLVEQAFPTCILVSYEDEGKTFRGVLLHETSHTVTRATVSQAIDNNDSSSRLCLTAARAVTCESNEPPASSSRVSTRSSTMSQDQVNKPNAITPIHKIRGLVKQLHSQKQKATTIEDTPQNQIEKSPKKCTLMSSMKRKRANSDSMAALKLRKVKTEEEQPSSKFSLSHNISPLFPVLKLRRTAGSTNSYVAVSLDSENKCGLDEPSYDPSSDQNSVITQDHTTHKHNTRFKGQKQTSHSERLNTRKNSGMQKQESASLCDESLVEVYTERTTTISANSSMLHEKPKGRQLNAQANKAYAKRGVTPRTHNQQMRVGEVVWGKVHGHPWWPGRILGILCHASESEASFVKVAWYGSTTTSEISCSFLMTFQENFKQLFKKQKTGAYRRAVREAQQDLQVMALDGQVMPI